MLQKKDAPSPKIKSFYQNWAEPINTTQKKQKLNS
jgi:hypothetical protein